MFMLQVRGAPLIGVVGALSLAVELQNMTFKTSEDLLTHVTKQLTYLITSRPTAVNISDMRDRLLAKLLADASTDLNLPDIQARYLPFNK